VKPDSVHLITVLTVEAVEVFDSFDVHFSLTLTLKSVTAIRYTTLEEIRRAMRLKSRK
jgi:hypothetical protein